METYIFLSIQDKKNLIKLANAKNLSISTTAGIIINNLWPIVTKCYTEYIKKGERMIHIKVKARNIEKLTSMDATNCIYCYFNKPQYKGQKINWQHKYIQKELDTTEDPNVNKNMEIRIAYRVRENHF